MRKYISEDITLLSLLTGTAKTRTCSTQSNSLCVYKVSKAWTFPLAYFAWLEVWITWYLLNTSQGMSFNYHFPSRVKCVFLFLTLIAGNDTVSDCGLSCVRFLAGSKCRLFEIIMEYTKFFRNGCGPRMSSWALLGFIYRNIFRGVSLLFHVF